MDQVARRDGFARDERARIFRRLSRSDQRQIEAFRDGVNAYIHKITLDPTLLPLEFAALGPPEPWDETDTVAVAVLEFVVFGANGGQEGLNPDLPLDLLHRFPPPPPPPLLPPLPSPAPRSARHSRRAPRARRSDGPADHRAGRRRGRERSRRRRALRGEPARPGPIPCGEHPARGCVAARRTGPHGRPRRAPSREQR